MEDLRGCGRDRAPRFRFIGSSNIFKFFAEESSVIAAAGHESIPQQEYFLN
jgi:hypothetical protein